MKQKKEKKNIELKIKADSILFFDMDGTLIDSGYAITNTINYVRVNLGFEKLEKNYILEKVNDPTINSAEFFYGTKEFTPLQVKLFEEYYKETFKEY